MRSCHLLPLLTLAALTAQADTLYKCTDSAGHTTYTNQKAGAKNCTVLSQDQPVSTMAAPPRRSGGATPAEFPRVSSDQQKARDNDRRSILQQELANEQKQLDDAKKALAEQETVVDPSERFNNGKTSGINGAKVDERIQPFRDAVALHQKNVEALNKEIANLK